MVVRFAYDFNDQQLEEIARAIDGSKKRRKGAKPRKASRRECLGLIEGALKRALGEAFVYDPLPAADLDRLARGEASLGRSQRNPAADNAEPFDSNPHGDDPAPEMPALEDVRAEVDAAIDVDDPICLRRNCGKPRSRHSRMGHGCPGVKVFQAGTFDTSTRNDYEAPKPRKRK